MISQMHDFTSGPAKVSGKQAFEMAGVKPSDIDMAMYGTTHEQLAEIAVATRKWAALNPKAMYRDPLTIDDVLKTRWVAWPFHLLDCCLVTDAGGAVIVTSAERARDLRKPPVYVLGDRKSVV